MASGDGVVADATPREPEDELGDGRWRNLHNLFLAEANDKEPDVLFLGDSHVALLEQSDVYRDLFAPLHCLCFGIMGETTSGLLWRLTNGELRNLRPKLVVLSIGGFNGDADEGAIAAGVEALVRMIAEQQPDADIFVLKLLPVGREVCARRRLHERVNGRLESVVPAAGGRLLDADAGFVGADGLMDHHDLFDYRHLSQQGYSKAFELVHVAVQSVLSPEQCAAE